MNNPNNWDNQPQIQNFLSPTKGIPQILAIFETISTYLILFLVELKAQPKYSGLDTNTTGNFSNNAEYTLQLQASTQLTMLRTVLDHNPNAFMTV